MNSDQDTTELLKRALALLARREHCRAELARKLLRHAANRTVLESVLDRCHAENWLNDARYAAMVARHRAQAGWGARRVEYELMSAGVSEGDIRAGLAEANVDWLGAAAKCLLRKRLPLATEQDRWKARSKLMQRGFTQEQAEQALEEVLTSEERDIPLHGRW